MNMNHSSLRSLLTRQDAGTSSSSSIPEDFNFSMPSSFESFSIPASSNSQQWVPSFNVAQEIQAMGCQLNEIQSTLKVLVERESGAQQAGELPIDDHATSVSLFTPLQAPKRVVHHPRQCDINPKKGTRKAQFSWQVMEWLVDVVARTQLEITPTPQEIQDACNNAKGKLIPSVIDDICATFDIPIGMSWGQIPKRAQWAAIFLMEERVRCFIPLGSCIAHWGASMMIAKFWSATSSNDDLTTTGIYNHLYR